MKVAVIPARGGSKRIPGKNIRDFAGRPMIAWSIEAALASRLYDRVIVSTDDDQIAEVARHAGAEVPFRRPANLADDHCGTIEVIGHAARWMAEAGWQVDAICCIYATAPLLSPADLASGLEQLETGRWDYVIGAGRFTYPAHRGFLRAGDGRIELLFPEHRLTRSQDLPAVFHDAGQFYWGHSQAWREEREMLGTNSSFVELPPWRVQDIDTPDDWKMAEYLFEMHVKDGNGH